MGLDLRMGEKEAMLATALFSDGNGNNNMGDPFSLLQLSELRPSAMLRSRFRLSRPTSENQQIGRPQKFWWDVLVTMPLIFVSLLIVVVAYVISISWLLYPVTGHRFFRKMHEALVIALIGHYFFFRTTYCKHFANPKVVFVVYPEEKMFKGLQEKLKLARWFWYEKNFVMGNLYWGEEEIGLVVLVPPLGTFESNKELLAQHVAWVVGYFCSAHIALAGQLPSVLSHLNLSAAANKRIVNGRIGTVALARQGAQHGLQWLRSQRRRQRRKNGPALCVLGGGGYTGKEISGACSDLFATIYLIDSKFSQQPKTEMEGASLVYQTSNAAYIRKADVVLVFLPRGDQIVPYVKYAHGMQVWIDDTHPPISTAVRADLCKVTNLFRLSARSTKMGMWPPLPNWRSQDLPGCLLTAMVLAFGEKFLGEKLPKSFCLADAEDGENGIQDFVDAAEDLGIELGMFPIEETEAFKVMKVSLTPT